MSKDAIQKGLISVEALATALIQESHKTRMLIEKEGVSTPSADQPLTQQQLAAISAKRRARLLKIKGK